VHNIDLTGQAVPWPAIGQLDALEELSLWNCGFGGPIAAAALCKLPQLSVLAMSQNNLRGTLPECITRLALNWLWLEDNRVHGPISEFSKLGQYLKGVGSLNLAQNRWAPLLGAEKAALQAIAEPLGVTAAEPTWIGHGWDFTYSYAWDWVYRSGGDRLTAARDVSYRYWGPRVPAKLVHLDIPFGFPGPVDVLYFVHKFDGDMNSRRQQCAMEYPGGDLAVIRTPSENTRATKACLTWSLLQEPDSPNSRRLLHEQPFCAIGMYVDDSEHHGLEKVGPWRWVDGVPMGVDGRLQYNQMALGEPNGDGTIIIISGKTGVWYDWSTQEVPTVDWGTLCSVQPPAVATKVGIYADATFVVLNDVNSKASVEWAFAQKNAEPRATHGVQNTAACWTSLPQIVPDIHTISEAWSTTTASSQGAAYLSERFCPGWAKFIAPADCDPAEPDCTGDAARGSAIFDGGRDMYDLGNILTTSLMGSCTADPHECPLGSLRYYGNFEVVETECFGPGGRYQMTKHDGVWVFFTHNAGDTPLDFMVAGNLGSDGSGEVTEYTFEATPYIGFGVPLCLSLFLYLHICDNKVH
jgi:hypothetical protein